MNIHSGINRVSGEVKSEVSGTETIIVINGSPKGEKSNTMQLTGAFLEGAGRTNAEIINVSQANVKSCLGCYSCWKKTPGKCVINDGMSEILSKLITADVVIWSFPLYYFNVPGGLKNLIDRQLPFNMPFMSDEKENGSHPPRYDLSRQRHVVISTCGFWTAKGNYDSVTAMFNRYFGKDQYAEIFCGQGELFSFPELKDRTNEYLEIVRRAGAEYSGGGIQEETQAELSQPLYPQDVFEKMADASWGINKETGESVDESLTFTTQMAALYKPDGIERRLEFYYTDINKTYQILLTKNGSQVVTENFKTYTTRIETPFSVWRSIARGEISGQEALFQRMYSVLGDFDLMLHWDELFGASTVQKKPVKEKNRKPNMAVLLFPWIVIWVAIAINKQAGGIAGICSAAFLPLLWLVFRPIVFEQISVPIIAGLSLSVLLGLDARIIITLSYGLFGLMWFIGAFTKIPLTAHYSASGYGDEKAFDNPLFIKTNRILTLVWLYLVTPVWTYIIMGTNLAVYTGLINSVCPALMGIFTAWFQKWYPAWRAASRV